MEASGLDVVRMPWRPFLRPFVGGRRGTTEARDLNVVRRDAGRSGASVTAPGHRRRPGDGMPRAVPLGGSGGKGDVVRGVATSAVAEVVLVFGPQSPSAIGVGRCAFMWKRRSGGGIGARRRQKILVFHNLLYP